MKKLLTTFIEKLYYSNKLPKWYKKIVCDIAIPTEISNNILKTQYNKGLTKDEVKQLLRDIQQANSKINKNIWDDYLENTLPTRYKNIKLEISNQSNFTAVIVEARKHSHFKVVVQNVILNLQHLNVCLNIYHGSENEQFIKEELKDLTNVKFINLGVENLDIEAYNKIILSKEFWEGINSEKILVFQTDSITFKPINKEFLKYDYIGAPWKKHIRKKNKVDVGNGGLSLRSKEMMLSVIEQNIPRKNNMPEDVYICQILKRQNYKLASYNTALEFATENIFNEQAFGCHKIWEETTEKQLRSILK